MATDTQLKALSEALSFNRPPFCSGIISPSSEGFHLYVGEPTHSKRLRMS